MTQREKEIIHKTLDDKVTYHNLGPSFWKDWPGTRVYMDQTSWEKEVATYCVVPKFIKEMDDYATGEFADEELTPWEREQLADMEWEDRNRESTDWGLTGALVCVIVGIAVIAYIYFF